MKYFKRWFWFTNLSNECNSVPHSNKGIKYKNPENTQQNQNAHFPKRKFQLIVLFYFFHLCTTLYSVGNEQLSFTNGHWVCVCAQEISHFNIFVINTLHWKYFISCCFLHIHQVFIVWSHALICKYLIVRIESDV